MRTLLILLLSLFSFQLVADDAPHYEQARVQKIQVILRQDGTEAEDDKIRTRLKTKEGSLFLRKSLTKT